LGPEKMNLQGRAILGEEISNWDFAVPVCVCVCVCVCMCVDEQMEPIFRVP